VDFAAVDSAAARFAGADFAALAFLAVEAFDDRLDRTGRSVMTCTSLIIEDNRITQ
jgi:hypothetical protein